jgi:hypothetical protein
VGVLVMIDSFGGGSVAWWLMAQPDHATPLV